MNKRNNEKASDENSCCWRLRWRAQAKKSEREKKQENKKQIENGINETV